MFWNKANQIRHRILIRIRITTSWIWHHEQTLLVHRESIGTYTLKSINSNKHLAFNRQLSRYSKHICPAFLPLQTTPFFYTNSTFIALPPPSPTSGGISWGSGGGLRNILCQPLLAGLRWVQLTGSGWAEGEETAWGSGCLLASEKCQDLKQARVEFHSSSSSGVQ